MDSVHANKAGRSSLPVARTSDRIRKTNPLYEEVERHAMRIQLLTDPDDDTKQGGIHGAKEA